MSAAGHEPLARHALAFVLAGGRGSRLMELTDRRAKPAVYFGGKSRIIDFALSNAMNSGIRRIAVATQYKAHSLIRHLQMGWNFFRPERNESFDILPASQRVSETSWYVGTADAVYQNIDIIEAHDARFIVLLAGDHIYKMDYELMLQPACRQRRRRHRRLPRNAARGIVRLRHHAYRRERLDPVVPGEAGRSAADAGQAGRLARQHGHLRVRHEIPVRRSCKRDAEDPNSSHDFGKDIIPYIVKNGRAMAHQFTQLLRPLRQRPALLLARRRHGGCLLGRQYRPHRRGAGARSVRPRLADLDLCGDHAAGEIRPRRGEPARRGRDVRWSRAAASSPARRCGARCCSPACASIPMPMSRTP